MKAAYHIQPVSVTAIFLVVELRRDVDIPIRERPAQGIKPFGQAGLTGVDLLTAAD